jgi:hypothetical protein
MAGVAAETVALIAAGGTAVGALIGAATGGAVNYSLDNLRNRRQARIAARLVRRDLHLAASHFSVVEAEGKWYPEYQVSTASFDRYEEILADKLSTIDLGLTSVSVEVVRRIDLVLQKHLVDGAQYIVADDADSWRNWQELVTIGYNALAALAEEPKSPSVIFDIARRSASQGPPPDATEDA